MPANCSFNFSIHISSTKYLASSAKGRNLLGCCTTMPSKVCRGMFTYLGMHSFLVRLLCPLVYSYYVTVSFIYVLCLTMVGRSGCHCPRTCHLWVSMILKVFLYQVPPSLCPVGELVFFGVLAGELVLCALEGLVWSVEPVCTLLWVIWSLLVVGSIFVWFSSVYAWAHATDGIVLLPSKVHV